MSKSGKPQDQTSKLSSHESWNKIIEEVAKRADRTIDENKSTLEARGLSMLNVQEIVNNRLTLGDKLKESFKQTFDDDKFTKNLDPKTVELFKKNNDKLAEYIISKSEDVRLRGGEAHVKDMTENMKHSVTEFNAKAQVGADKNKKLDWQKAADFCKSIKMDKLAKYCHDKHVEGLAKEVSKSLEADLAKHNMKTSPDSKRRMPSHDDHGR